MSKEEARLSDREPSRKRAGPGHTPRVFEVPYPYRRHVRLVAMMVVGFAVGAYLIGRAYGGAIAAMVSMAGSVVVALTLSNRTGTVLPDGAILSIFVGVIMGIFVPQLQWLGNVPRLHQTTPVALPDAPQAGVFTFREGTQVPGFTGFLDVTVESKDAKGKRTTSKKLYAAAPLVGPGWTREQPVPAWSLCESHSGARSECEELFRTAVRAGISTERHDSHFREAIAVAEQEHGLRSMKGARLVELVPDADQEIRDKWRNLVIAVLIVFGLWAVILSIPWAWQTRRQRRQAARYR